MSAACSDEVYIGQIAFWRTTDGGRKGGKNDYAVNPPITDNSWTVLGCCLHLPNPYRKNMDLHGDIHDIVFAPYGSFVPTPSEVQIVYVANDGGVTKGSIDFEGVIHWLPLTKGMAIGQIGTIGLAPTFAAATNAGYWHNGTILNLSPSIVVDSIAVRGGDGFQASVDAGNLSIYFNCNAGFNGQICRALQPPPFFPFKDEAITNPGPSKHWSDPHRPGHLIRLDTTPITGLLFRTTVANTASASQLKTADAWEAIDPFWGKTGKTTTMAFRSRRLEEAPVYYLGTDTGQVWRGSPEVGWSKLCECGAFINSIAPHLFENERIFVALRGATSPGRIKEISRSPNGSWQVKNIDAAFAPTLDVQQVISIIVDPAIRGIRGTTVYVGTDQGVYQGHVDSLILDPTIMAAARIPPIFGDWTWRRSPGVPNIWVPDLEVHQNFQAHDSSGIIRAGTYGRGIFELRRGRRFPSDMVLPTLEVEALKLHTDGAPSYLNVDIPIRMNGKPGRGSTPFELSPGKGARVTLEAPDEIRVDDGVMGFLGWAVAGKQASTGRSVTLTVDEVTIAVAYYGLKQRLIDRGPEPLTVTLSTAAQELCVQGLSHEWNFAWQVLNGTPPTSVRAEIRHPDGHMELVELKSIEGTHSYSVNAPRGGKIEIRVIASDTNEGSTVVARDIALRPCSQGN